MGHTSNGRRPVVPPVRGDDGSSLAGEFVWARVENHKPVFTTVEKVLVAVVAATSVAAVIGLVQGFVSV